MIAITIDFMITILDITMFTIMVGIMTIDITVVGIMIMVTTILGIVDVVIDIIDYQIDFTVIDTMINPITIINIWATHNLVIIMILMS